MHEDSLPSGTASHAEPIVAVFDTKTMALRTIAELAAAQISDLWLAVVRGETGAGETLVVEDGGEEMPLADALIERGTAAVHARRFDGILPPGSAVLSLRANAKLDQARTIIEVTGGHIEH